MELYCGIDLHSNNGVYGIVNGDGKRVFKKRLKNDLRLILETLEPYKVDLKSIAVESTYNWYWLVDGLEENGYPIHLANPAAINQYDGLKLADDDTDALFLAELQRLNILKEGYIYPKKDRAVRDLLRRRMLLVHQRTSLILSVENLLIRQTGQRFGWNAVRRLDREAITKLLSGDEYLVFTIRHQLGLIRYLSEKIALFENKVLEKIKLRPEFERLLTIPGVGLILGLTIMVETGDIHRFKKVGNYTSYCRCARAKHISNGKKKSENNRKNGNRYLSWAFVEAAHHAMRCCAPARTFYQRKVARKNGALGTKALASKWTKAAYYILKRQEDFNLQRVFG